MYGKFDGGVLLVSDKLLDGYKPMVETEAPTPKIGYEAGFFWVEEANRIIQTWDEHTITEPQIDDSEALSIILGGAT